MSEKYENTIKLVREKQKKYFNFAILNIFCNFASINNNIFLKNNKNLWKIKILKLKLLKCAH